MSKILILSQADICHVLDMEMSIASVESAYCQKAAGEGKLLPVVFHEFAPGEADMDIKSGHLAASGIYGLKLVSWFGENADKRLPQLYGTTLVFDDTTGEPIALLNAGGMTGMRTGAAGAIGAKYLAKPGASTLLMVGTGEQSSYLIAATLIALPNVTTVRLSNPHAPQRAGERLDEIHQEVVHLLHQSGHPKDFAFSATLDLAEAVNQSDIIITATPSRSPLIQREWVQPGTHISCIGADMSGKQELDGKILACATVYVDDLTQALSVGECELPIKQGQMGVGHIAGEIGAVISGKLPGRTSAQDITVFDSTGIALQDLVVSKTVIQRAKEQGIGTIVNL